jgi:formate dehydrogenase major subunit
MTNHWNDLKNSDCVMIIGSNAAENHPMSFKWITKAVEERGCKIISVDPRFTRTSARAHLYAPLRPGTDIAFINGLIYYAISNNLYNREYVANYTNASFIVSESFNFADGLFTGYDPKSRTYDRSKHAYELGEDGFVKRDMTLQHPRCVFQLMWRHFRRYDPDTVSRITGMPRATFLQVAELYCSTGAKDKAGTICYAMGTTQHTVGTQNVRSYAILQLLLGNIGMPGGGVNAMRGESNVQGSTDMALLFHILPGYLRPAAPQHRTLADYLAGVAKATTPDSVNYWKNTSKFMVSLLKAWWGDKATTANDFCFDYLPRIAGNYSHISLFEAMYAGTIKGLFLFGQNPAVGGPNSKREIEAMTKLDWMVAVDLWETDSSVFWKAPGIDPAKVQTEVFLLPAAASFEKEGTVSNSGRWCQWRYTAAPPPGDAKPDLDILNMLAIAIKQAYAGSTARKDRPVLDLNWNYGTGHVDPHVVAKEINGYDTLTGRQVASFAVLKDDGTTACGNWVYSGGYNENGNLYARRDASDPSGLGLYPNWAWCWPLNRRIVYNRASCDPAGRPWDPNRAAISWDAAAGKWVLYDVPDFVAAVPPEQSAKSPFIMHADGVGGLFSLGVTDGPFPEHYEPYESPVKNHMSSQQLNPIIKLWDNAKADIGSKDFPLVGTTYRVTEHWQTGPMTRNLPWLAELMPELFVEISEELAALRGISNGETVKVVTARGEVLAKACVTRRFKALKVEGETIEIVGLPWHFGFNGYVTGGPDRKRNYAANVLTAHIGDANTMIPEYKAFLCDVRKVR